MLPRSYTLLSLCLLALCGCGSSEDAGAPSSPAPTAFTELDEATEAFLATHGLEGATLVVVTRDAGVVHQKGFGAFGVDRVSLLASASKVLSAGVLVRLADQGLLDLDEPIATYLSDWGDHKGDVTVAQLLSNSSGLPGLLEDPTYAPYLCQFLFGGTLAQCAEAIYTADDEAARVPPDSEFRYGGGQWQLAGGVAEVVSGKPWVQLIEETYRVPCGMTHTGYANHFSKAQGTNDDLTGYPSFFQGNVDNLDVTDNPNIEGGGYSTVGDYAQVLLMHLRGGRCGDTRVLSEEGVDRMQADRIGEVYDGTTFDPTMPGYGMGWWNARNEPVVSDAGAYGAMPWLDLERGYGAMLIIEAEATLGALYRIEAKPIIERILDEGT